MTHTCKHCNKTYKTQRTFDRYIAGHILKFHPNIEDEVEEECFDIGITSTELEMMDAYLPDKKSKINTQLEDIMNNYHAKQEDAHTPSVSTLINSSPSKGNSINKNKKILSSVDIETMTEEKHMALDILQEEKKSQNKINKYEPRHAFGPPDPTYNFTDSIKTPLGKHSKISVEEFIKQEVGYEAFIDGGYKPYYDFDPKYLTESEGKANTHSDLDEYYDRVLKVFPNARNIYVFSDARRIAPDRDGNVWKNSMHMIVEGVGYYLSMLDFPHVEGRDMTAYKKPGSRQLFRAPYMSKKEGESNDGYRMCRAIKFDGGEIWTMLTMDDALNMESYTDWLVQYVVYEDLIPCEITYDVETKVNATTRPKITTSHTNRTKLNDDSAVRMLVSLIPDMIADEYDIWRNLCWALASISDDNDFDLQDLAHTFASKSSKYCEIETDELYLNANSNGPRLGMNYVIGIAKEYNPMATDAWLTMTQMKWQMDEFKKTQSLLDAYLMESPEKKCDSVDNSDLGDFERVVILGPFTDSILARLFLSYPKYSGKFIYYDGQNYHYDGWWRLVDDSHLYNNIAGMLYSNLKKCIDAQFGASSNVKQYAELLKKFCKLQNWAGRTGIVKSIQAECELNVSHGNPFNKNADLLGFHNGVMELNTDVFRPMTPEDMVSKVCPYDYTTPDEQAISEVNEMIHKIMPNDDERKCLLTLLSTALDGRVLDRVVIFTGAGRNGKDTLATFLLQATLGDDLYYYQTPNVICDKQKGGVNQEIANMGGKRAVVISEPPSDQTMKCATLKMLTGTNQVNARGCYSKDTKTNLNQSLFILANDIPELDTVDNAIYSRLIVVPFLSLFRGADEIKQYPEDTPQLHLKDRKYIDANWVKAHRVAFMTILMEHYPLYRDAGYSIRNVPKSIDRQRADYITESSELTNWFFATYEISEDEDDRVKMKDVFDQYKSSDLYMNMRKDRKRKFNKKILTKQIAKHPSLRGFYKEKMDFKKENGKKSCVRNVIVKMRLRDDVQAYSNDFDDYD